MGQPAVPGDSSDSGSGARSGARYAGVRAANARPARFRCGCALRYGRRAALRSARSACVDWPHLVGRKPTRRRDRTAITVVCAARSRSSGRTSRRSSNAAWVTWARRSGRSGGGAGQGVEAGLRDGAMTACAVSGAQLRPTGFPAWSSAFQSSSTAASFGMSAVTTRASIAASRVRPSARRSHAKVRWSAGSMRVV